MLRAEGVIVCLRGAGVGRGAAARAAERVDPPGGSARRSVLSRRRLAARPADGHRREPRRGRLHPVAVRAHGPEGRRAERLLLPAVQPDDRDRSATRRSTASRSRRRRLDAPAGRRAGVLSAPLQRERHGGRLRRVRRLRHQRAAPRLRRLRRRREGQDRPRARSRAGRARSRTVRSTASSPRSRRPRGERRWPRRRRARSRCCSSATCTTIRARRTSRPSARNYWPEKPPHLLSYTLAAWADRIQHPGGADFAGARRVARRRQPARRSRISRSRRKPRAGSRPCALPGTRVTVHTAVDRHIVPDRNVVALLEGSDPRLKNEWVIVSAHYDHNGADATQIFNGADDNGSGVVALHRDRRGVRAGREGGAPAEAQHPVRRRGTRRSAACSAPGRTPSSRWRR